MNKLFYMSIHILIYVCGNALRTQVLEYIINLIILPVQRIIILFDVFKGKNGLGGRKPDDYLGESICKKI